MCLPRNETTNDYGVPMAMNGQAERNDTTIILRERHYVAGHQQDWDINVQPLPYAYNAEVHCSIDLKPSALMLS